MNLTTLLQGNNMLCFVFEVLKFVSPNALSGLFSTLEVPLDLLNNVLDDSVLDLGLGCPAFKDLTAGGKPVWEGLEDLFPGALKSASIL